ncbi:hypothetical protein GOBAR_AA38543 [Gossypium barbadense]|uniref:Uncharacterized protein n=1 Tax=Gossypium barbadense TaxID=3634 RepID=A0A2P5VTJ8_GOSBA|nr:hypothetical protein GOBAR_AA38543 [Gossypium barbadense]
MTELLNSFKGNSFSTFSLLRCGSNRIPKDPSAFGPEKHTKVGVSWAYGGRTWERRRGGGVVPGSGSNSW